MNFIGCCGDLWEQFNDFLWFTVQSLVIECYVFVIECNVFITDWNVFIIECNVFVIECNVFIIECWVFVDVNQSERNDLSHPVHSDNCFILPDGSCLKRPPAYVYRDFTYVRTVIFTGLHPYVILIWHLYSTTSKEAHQWRFRPEPAKLLWNGMEFRVWWDGWREEMVFRVWWDGWKKDLRVTNSHRTQERWLQLLGSTWVTLLDWSTMVCMRGTAKSPWTDDGRVPRPGTEEWHQSPKRGRAVTSWPRLLDIVHC